MAGPLLAPDTPVAFVQDGVSAPALESLAAIMARLAGRKGLYSPS